MNRRTGQAVPTGGSPIALAERTRTFFRKSRSQKYAILVRRLHKWFPNAALPIRLPQGIWWLARQDHIGRPILEGNFENAEYDFIRAFLQRGMTVLDVGAHHGFYTVLASKLVGQLGKVIAFEPSPRERKALRLNIVINRLKNISIQGVALADEDSEANLYVVQEYATGCNSLRPPAHDVPNEARPVPVRTTQLDSWLASANIDHVDFIKLDVEGAELAVLTGAANLLQRQPRPVILAEVQDVRTQPWGYRAREIVAMLERFGYVLFQPIENGGLRQADTNIEDFDLNLVAIPKEQTRSVLARINAPKTGSED
jgi:FkbM family methyltransferase